MEGGDSSGRLVHHGRVRPPPPFLPGQQSRRWHTRQAWDPLGHVRVHTLGDPEWARDAAWLLDLLVGHRPSRPGAARDLMDLAIRETRSYRALRRPPADSETEWAERLDAQWDRVLEALDTYLSLVQADRAAAVQSTDP